MLNIDPPATAGAGMTGGHAFVLTLNQQGKPVTTTSAISLSIPAKL